MSHCNTRLTPAGRRIIIERVLSGPARRACGQGNGDFPDLRASGAALSTLGTWPPPTS
jgi:hypothetical protein